MPDTSQPNAGPEASDAPPTQLRKLVKTHNFESVTYALEKLEKLLVSCTHDNGTQY